MKVVSAALAACIIVGFGTSVMGKTKTRPQPPGHDPNIVMTCFDVSFDVKALDPKGADNNANAYALITVRGVSKFQGPINASADGKLFAVPVCFEKGEIDRTAVIEIFTTTRPIFYFQAPFTVDRNVPIVVKLDGGYPK